MKLVVKRNRELAPINSQNTQNENRAETIELIVPEEYESFNKKIVFITPNETVWDVITNNQYKITNAITNYDKVDYYIWLTKEVDGESIDFRTKTKTLNFYHNEDASDEITDEEIHGVNTVVNLLEEEIEKVENLNIEATKIGDTTTVTITKKDGTTESVEINDGVDGQDGQDGYTPQKGIDYFTQEDIEEIETDVKNDLEENVLVNYSLIAETGAKIELSINQTNYKLTAILKDKNNNIIHTSNVIDLPLETMVVNATYDNVNKAIILTLQNGTTVSISVADLVSGLVSESQLQTILANYYTKTEINNLLANKVDKVAGKGLSTNDFTDEYKEQVDTNTEDIEDIQDEQTEQNTEIEKLQTENARFKATLPTTGEVTGQNITLNKTAELEFKKPPLPMGNSEQVQYSGKNLFNIENVTATEGSTTDSRGKVELIDNGFRLTKTTETGNNNGRFLSEISCNLPVGTYIITGNLKLSAEINLYLIGNGFEVVMNTSNVNKTFTVSSNITQIRFCFNSATDINNYAEFTNIMIRDSSITDDTYEPYVGGTASPNPDYPQEITNVTGDVEVVVGNKNLCKNVQVVNNSNLRFYFNPKTVNKNIMLSFTSNENLAGNSIFLDLDGVSKGRIGYTGSSNTRIEKSITFTDEIFNLFNSSNEGIITIYKVGAHFIIPNDAQIENGLVPTDYVEHKSQTFTFPLGNEKLMLGDYLADDGIHHVRKQTEITENNINLVYSATSQFGVKCANIRKDALGYKTAWGSRYCLINKYSEISTVQEVRSGTFGTVFDQIYLRIFDDRFTNTETAKQLLIGTIIEILLAEEEIVPYTSAQQEVYNEIKNAYSYDEMTIITGSSDGNKPFFTVQTYKDLNKELNNKVDKVQGKELSSNDFTDVLKEKLEGLENYDDTEIKADISDIQEEQTEQNTDIENIQEEQVEQNTDIENLQEENARLKATLPTTTGEGQDVTLDKTAEMEFVKPPLPRGNTKQDTTTGKNLLNTSNANTTTINGVTSYRNNGFYYLSGTNTKTNATWILPNTQNTNLPTFEIGQTYTMSFKGTLPSGIYAQLNGVKTSTGTQYSIGSVRNTVPSVTFTIDSDYSSTAQLFVGIQGATTNVDCNFAIQIEKGSTATSYEPYTRSDKQVHHQTIHKK